MNVEEISKIINEYFLRIMMLFKMHGFMSSKLIGPICIDYIGP